MEEYTMNAVDVYQTYLAVKQHFSDSTYDYFKYGGKIRVNKVKFETKNLGWDKTFCEKLALRFKGKSKDLEKFFVSTLSKHPYYVIRDLAGYEADENYRTWKAYQESLTYNFQQDVSKIGELYKGPFDELFMCRDGQHSFLLTLYTNSEIAIETLIGFDILLGCFDRWNKEIDDPIVWPDIYTYCQRYRPFLRVEEQKFRQILKEEFVP